ncbi:MAG: hypothetical protein QXW13_00010 [Nanopusillaceae archaeon]
MNFRFIHLFAFFYFYIICIFFITITSLINSFRLVAESSSHDLLFTLISLKLNNNTINFSYIGYCLQIAILEGLQYSIKYNDSFYLVFYPTIKHAAVIINQTLYTTSYIFDNFRLIYECNVDDSVRNAILSNNNSMLYDILLEYFRDNSLLVKCKLSFKKYNNVALILFSKVLL